MCREEGKAIADLAARQDNPLDGFGIFGLVKEVGVDDEGEENILSLVVIEFEANLNQYFLNVVKPSPHNFIGLAEFQSSFFPFPLYKDEE